MRVLREMQAFKALPYSAIRTGASRAQLGAALSDGLVASFDCTDTVEGTLLGYTRGQTLLDHHEHPKRHGNASVGSEITPRF